MILLLAACFHTSEGGLDPCAAEFAREELEGAKVRTIGTLVPDATGAHTLRVKLAWPDRAPAEGERWPQVLGVQGAWAHQISEEGRPAVAEGVVEARVDLPGGGQSGGTDDRRGAESRAAVAAVLRYLAGETTDVGGCTAQRRTGGGAPDDLHLLGVSNGGNLAVATLADPALSLPPVRGLVTWETPISPQFVTVEFGGTPTVYQEGSCAWAADRGLTCAVDLARFVEEAAIDRPSVLCFDTDDDGACTDGVDVLVAGAEDPLTGVRMLSPTLTAAAAEAGFALHGFGTTEEATAWWAERDASLGVAAMVARHPDLAVLLIGSEEDHVQTCPDHPHVYGWGEALQASGAAWTRLNPGADWLAGLGDDNPANAPLTLADGGGALLTEDEESPLGAVLAAAVRELSAVTGGS